MNIRIQEGLPYVTVTLHYRRQQLRLNKVLLDTGSAGTIFAVDKLDAINLLPEPHDDIHQIRGVGGTEFVFTKEIEKLSLDTLHVSPFEIEVGAMDYGFDLDGIVGMDFLMQTRAIVDLAKLIIHTANET